jgi:hypothetical protein
VSSCANGHAVPAGAERCGICGEDVRPLCYQGHRSSPGSRFCDTCGALLAAEPAATAATAAELPAADLVTDYTSGSFSDFFAPDAAGGSDDGTPIRPAAAASGKAAASSAASAAAHVRRARRWQSLGMGLAVLIAAVIIGEFVLHDRTGHQAKATVSPLGITSTASATATPTAAPDPSPTVPASATPTLTPAPAPTPAAVPAQQVIPAATGRQPEPAGPDGHYRGFPTRAGLPGHFVLPGPPFVPGGFGDGQRQDILRIVLPFAGFPRGGLPDHGGFDRR